MIDCNSIVIRSYIFAVHTYFLYFIYRVSSYSFRGNYSFLDLEIQRSEYIRPKVTLHKCAETIQGRKLYEEIRYDILTKETKDKVRPYHNTRIFVIYYVIVKTLYLFSFLTDVNQLLVH